MPDWRKYHWNKRNLAGDQKRFCQNCFAVSQVKVDEFRTRYFLLFASQNWYKESLYNNNNNNNNTVKGYTSQQVTHIQANIRGWGGGLFKEELNCPNIFFGRGKGGGSCYLGNLYSAAGGRVLT